MYKTIILLVTLLFPLYSAPIHYEILKESYLYYMTICTISFITKYLIIDNFFEQLLVFFYKNNNRASFHISSIIGKFFFYRKTQYVFKQYMKKIIKNKDLTQEECYNQCKYFLDLGANPNISYDDNYRNLLSYASWFQKNELVELLLLYKADPDGQSHIHYNHPFGIFFQGRTDLATETTGMSRNPLANACYQNSYEIAFQIIKAGCKTNPFLDIGLGSSHSYYTPIQAALSIDYIDNKYNNLGTKKHKKNHALIQLLMNHTILNGSYKDIYTLFLLHNIPISGDICSVIFRKYISILKRKNIFDFLFQYPDYKIPTTSLRLFIPENEVDEKHFRQHYNNRDCYIINQLSHTNSFCSYNIKERLYDYKKQISANMHQYCN